MTVTLPPELEALVDRKVAEGSYDSGLQVIQTALQLLEARDQAKLEQLRADVAVGLAQLDRGEAIPSESVFHELREKSRRIRASQA
ncbi:MAG: ribbon-helix-helix domain-containing protein [Actinomycetota bacterium]